MEEADRKTFCHVERGNVPIQDLKHPGHSPEFLTRAAEEVMNQAGLAIGLARNRRF